MKQLIEVARTDEISAGQMKEVDVDVDGKPVLLANVGGSFYAIGGRCTHRGGVLAQGKLDGNVVTCPRHGSRFDVTTGKNLSGPKIFIFRLRTPSEPAYAVKVEGKSIKIEVQCLPL